MAQSSFHPTQKKDYNAAATGLAVLAPGPANNATWVDFGVGVSTVGLTAIAGLAHQFNVHVLSARGTYSGETLGDSVWEIGALYGIGISEQSSHFSVSGGLGLLGGTTRSNSGFFSNGSEEKIPLTLSVPLETNLIWRPVDFFGMGIHGFASINSERLFAGAALSIQIGDFR